MPQRRAGHQEGGILEGMSRLLELGVAMLLFLPLASCHLVFPYGARPRGEGREDAPAPRDAAPAEPAARDRPGPGKDLDATSSDTPPRETAAGDTSRIDAPRADTRRKEVGASKDTHSTVDWPVDFAVGSTCLTAWTLWKRYTPCGSYLQCCFSCTAAGKSFFLQCQPTGLCTCSDGPVTMACNGSHSCEDAWGNGCCNKL